MEASTHPSPPPAGEERSLSPLARAIAIFTRPSQAWVGLEHRAQFWFPLLLMLAVTAGTTIALYHRAILPMIESAWEKQIEAGRMTAEQMDQMLAFMSGPAGIAITVAQQVILFPVVLLIAALLVWFGVGFLLGARFRFRLAFEVVAWAWLIRIPEVLVITGMAWMRETMEGVHSGLGALLPVAEEPGKLQQFAAAILDAIGPLQIWFLIVGIIGASVLSGAPRKNVAWVLGGLYLVIAAFFVGLGVMLRPAS
jgi:hypothetical protein